MSTYSFSLTGSATDLYPRNYMWIRLWIIIMWIRNSYRNRILYLRWKCLSIGVEWCTRCVLRLYPEFKRVSLPKISQERIVNSWTGNIKPRYACLRSVVLLLPKSVLFCSAMKLLVVAMLFQCIHRVFVVKHHFATHLY